MPEPQRRRNHNEACLCGVISGDCPGDKMIACRVGLLKLEALEDCEARDGHLVLARSLADEEGHVVFLNQLPLFAAQGTGGGGGGGGNEREGVE